MVIHSGGLVCHIEQRSGRFGVTLEESVGCSTFSGLFGSSFGVVSCDGVSSGTGGSGFSI